MGSRLSMPKAPGGLTEASHPRTSPFPRNKAFNSRQLVAPVAAFSMACILFVYTRTSIRVAKANAQRHREVDSGGQGLDLLSESRRRHGRVDRLEEGGTVRQLAKGMGEQLTGTGKGAAAKDTERKERGVRAEEDKLKAAMGRRKDG